MLQRSTCLPSSLNGQMPQSQSGDLCASLADVVNPGLFVNDMGAGAVSALQRPSDSRPLCTTSCFGTVDHGAG
jgi:hypothetical protein